MCKVSTLSIASLALATQVYAGEGLPEGFVYLSDIDPSIITQLRYTTKENFMGRVIPGYVSNTIICTKPAALKLKEANTYFKSQGYTLVVYDAFRPQTAVDSFRHWGEHPTDIIAKPYYYPHYEKSEIFAHGYVADQRSSHTRGSTFDLTLIKNNELPKPVSYTTRVLENGETVPFLEDGTVDMGASFDLFHPVSGHDSPLVNEAQTKMRNFLHAPFLITKGEKHSLGILLKIPCTCQTGQHPALN